MASVQAFGVDTTKKETKDKQCLWDTGWMDMTSMLGKLKLRMLTWGCHWIGRCVELNDNVSGMVANMYVKEIANTNVTQHVGSTKQQ